MGKLDFGTKSTSGLYPVYLYAHLDADQQATTVLDEIPWHVDNEEIFTHSDGTFDIVIPETGDYLIMVTLILDHTQNGQTIAAELQKKDA